MPRAQIKDEKTYRELGAYQDWPKADLLQRAREIGIKGRSSMTKAQLISACATTDRQERGNHVPTVRNHPSPSQRAGQSLPPALANVLGHLRDAAASHDGEYPGGFLPAAGSPAEADADRSAAGSLTA